MSGPDGYLDTKPPCPGCGTRLDGFSVIGKDSARPKDGDISFCCYCGMTLEYYGTPLLQLRPLTGSKLIEVMANPKFRRTKEAIDEMILERLDRQSYPGDGKIVRWRT